MYIAMNRFKIILGKEVDFEEIWKSRETHLEKVPGFKKFTLKPIFPKEFTNVKGHYDNAFGTISVAWERDENSITLSFEVPTNSQCTLDLSLVESFDRQLFTKQKRKGSPIESIVSLGSGSYRIILTKTHPITTNAKLF